MGIAIGVWLTRVSNGVVEPRMTSGIVDAAMKGMGSPMKKACLFVFAFVVLAGVAPAYSQTFPQLVPEPVPVVTQAVSLSGPRLGITFLGQDIIDKLDAHDIAVGPVITQFGWQFEKRIYANRNGLTTLTEGVILVGGLEQGVVLPSLNWLVGVRTGGGAEFGFGPNITPLGVGLVIAAGATFRAGALNVPVNLAVVPSKSGVRVSFLTGFNTRRH